MRVGLIIAGVALLLASWAPQPAAAREARSEQVPNGQKLDCGLCHIDSAGEGPRNPFGTQIEEMGLDGVGPLETQMVVWSQIYMLDADGDGFTNGYELGDPDGTWVPTDNDPAVDPSLPGDPASVPCGNGSVHPDEDCDGADLAGQTCLSQGFTGGVLACTADCSFDTSGCMAAQFPDTGGSGGADMSSTPMQPDEPQMPRNPDAGAGANASSDAGSGCAGSLDVRYPDGGLDASLILFVLLFRRRAR